MVDVAWPPPFVDDRPSAPSTRPDGTGSASSGVGLDASAVAGFGSARSYPALAWRDRDSFSTVLSRSARNRLSAGGTGRIHIRRLYLGATAGLLLFLIMRLLGL
jgi:hypothetical protein